MKQDQLTEKRLEFLNDTINHFNSHNRCETNGLCKYSSTESSKGCAIGRFLTPELSKQLDARLENGLISDEVFELMPEKLKELGQEFLVRIQTLHDTHFCWNENGLSETGKEKVAEIIERFNLRAPLQNNADAIEYRMKVSIPELITIKEYQKQ